MPKLPSHNPDRQTEKGEWKLLRLRKLLDSNLPLTLTFTEEEVWRKFEAWLNIYGKTKFSSDDMREFGLHKLLRDPVHQVGSIFQTKLMEGKIREVEKTQSRIPSNHKRLIRNYEFTK